MALDAAYIRLRYPGVFDVVSDFSLSEAIAVASLQVNAAALGALTQEATLYLACHFAELGKPGRASGQQRGKAGQVEIDFGSGHASNTSFFNLYQQLVRRVVLPIGLIA